MSRKLKWSPACRRWWSSRGSSRTPPGGRLAAIEALEGGGVLERLAAPVDRPDGELGDLVDEVAGEQGEVAGATGGARHQDEHALRLRGAELVHGDVIELGRAGAGGGDRDRLLGCEGARRRGQQRKRESADQLGRKLLHALLLLDPSLDPEEHIAAAETLLPRSGSRSAMRRCRSRSQRRSANPRLKRPLRRSGGPRNRRSGRSRRRRGSRGRAAAASARARPARRGRRERAAPRRRRRRRSAPGSPNSRSIARSISRWAPWAAGSISQG